MQGQKNSRIEQTDRQIRFADASFPPWFSSCRKGPRISASRNKIRGYDGTGGAGGNKQVFYGKRPGKAGGVGGEEYTYNYASIGRREF